ncbi:hypothetical protein [Pedobacter frigoris]|uniref:DUF4374 domain-containing protein n=1 Tax=Pedobacter frigoris TaxID=2571272 RepID=A0A4U1CKE9_9SPHI|nr:hypothetical protein [Pedobacter frigoris]TKC07469.1 hypothetical protein FA047_09490 [Pedobacter frigoris]
MKQILIYTMLIALSLSSCKKNPKPVDPETIPPIENGGGTGDGTETIPATADIYLLGTKYVGYAGNYALWAERTLKENFTDYSLEGSGLEGIFIQENSGTKTVHFFGSKLFTQTRSRITYFNKKNYATLADQLNLGLSSSFTEAFIAHTTFNKSAYLLAAATATDLADKRYYYKINRNGTPTVHHLLPNKDYKFIAASNAGVYLSHTYDARLFWTDIAMYRDNNSLGNYRLEIQDFSYINPMDMVMVNDHTAAFICSARYDPTGATEYLYVTVNINTKASQSQRLGFPSNFSMGTMLVKDNNVLLFGNVAGDKAAQYYQLNGQGASFTLKKILLETNGTSSYSTNGIFDSGTNIFVSGTEGNTSVYWKDGKLVKLQNNSATSVIMHDIRN